MLRLYGFFTSKHDSVYVTGLLLGRPFGGIAILWRKSIGGCIQIDKYNDSRVMAIEYNNGNRKLLAVNIYMPCDDRSTNSANYDEFIKYLGMMHAIIVTFLVYILLVTGMLVLTAILSLVRSCLLFV